MVNIIMAEDKITKEMGIADVVTKFPNAAQVFGQYGMGCIGCAAARFENIEQGAKAHGIDDEKIAEMIVALNKAAEEDKEE